MTDLVIRRGDRLPVITRTVTVNDEVVVLNQATVLFKAKSASDGTVVIDSAAVVSDAANGVVQYTWTTPDSTLAAGFYFAWFEVTMDGKVLSAPNDGFITLQVTDEIGSFTYSGDPSARPLDQVRFLLQDTDSTDPLLSDAEILYVLNTAGGSVYQAAHDAAYAISAKFVRKADTSKSVGDLSLSVSYGNRAAEFRTLGDTLLEIGARREPPMPLVNMNALKSTGNRDLANIDFTTDFHVGQHDNLT